MKVIERAKAAKAAKAHHEYARGKALAERWMVVASTPDAVSRLCEWRGNTPMDIDELCDIAVGYQNAEVAQQFIADALGNKPETCRKFCIAGFYDYFTQNLNHNEGKK